MTIEDAIEAVLISKVLTGQLPPAEVDLFKRHLLLNYNRRTTKKSALYPLYPWVVEAMEVLHANDHR
jgi:hypothetical protein